MDDDDDDRHVCPICWDSYTNAKLLKCRHTFCTACLESFVKPEGGGSLKCPMCRSEVPIPQNGIDGFMNNYFVPNTEKKVDVVKIKCEMCNQDNIKIVKVCPHCKQKMCLSCSSSHKKALILSGASLPNTESDTEDDEERRSRQRRRNSYDPQLPLSLAFSLEPIKYNKVLDLCSSFPLDIIPDDQGKETISSICPMSDTECWVVPTFGPAILHCDITGKLKGVIPIDANVSSIEFRKDGSLLIAVIQTSQILRHSEGRVYKFASTHGILPFGMSSFPDGRIAVVGGEKNTKDDEDRGRLQIISPDGIVIETFGGKHKDQPLFKNPFSVVVNKHSAIFVCDRKMHCVYVMTDHGVVLNQYLGGRDRLRTPLFMRETGFDPIYVCADAFGNVIVNDQSNASLHMLDPNGNFIGLVMANKPEEFGRPFSIAIDNEDKIWIGDRYDKKVRVYECKAFANYLREDTVNPMTLPLDTPSDLYLQQEEEH